MRRSRKSRRGLLGNRVMEMEAFFLVLVKGEMLELGMILQFFDR